MEQIETLISSLSICVPLLQFSRLCYFVPYQLCDANIFSVDNFGFELHHLVHSLTPICQHILCCLVRMERCGLRMLIPMPIFIYIYMHGLFIFQQMSKFC